MTTMTVHPPLTRQAVSVPLRPTVRLTRRGRLLVFAVAFAAVVALFIVASGGTAATSDRHTDGTTRVMQVVPGETLWDVASDASGGTDVRDMMTRIEELNGLQTTQVLAGQRLRVPLG